MNYFYIVIIVIVIFIIFLALSMYDESHTYDLKLNLKKDDNGNYYFYTNVYIWQRNKLKQLKSAYRQGTIIKSDYDNSNYIVKNIDPVKNSIIIINVDPYIGPCTFKICIYDHEPFEIDSKSLLEIQNLQKEISTNHKNYESDCDYKDTIETLDKIKESKNVQTIKLEKLLQFIKKYETLFNISSSLIQTLLSILSLINS